MPEGPELKYISVFFSSKLLDKKLLNIIHINEVTQINSKILSISSKGKLLSFKCENDVYINLHFGLTGWPTTDSNHKHLKFTLEFEDEKIYIEDRINYAYVNKVTKKENEIAIDKLGIDILTEEFTLNTFTEIIQSHNAVIASFLLQQDEISGIGNYIKNECLYLSNISPKRKMGTLTKSEIKNLYNEIKYVAFSRLYSLCKGKNTKNSNFDISSNDKVTIPSDIKKISPEDLTIPYELNVHGKENDLLGNIVTYIKVSGRGTYYVKSLQK
jgi:formamidopyrimidine-DNA glycosylase